MSRDTRPAVWGPTWIASKYDGRWRVIVVTPEEDGETRRRSTRWFVEKEDADDFVEEIAAKLSRFTRTTASEAIDGYEQHLKDKGTIGYKETIRRLRAFFPQDITIGRITQERAKSYYEKFRQRLRPDGEPISVAYHRAALINARSFLTWCIDQGWIDSNPLAKVKGIGKKNRGKKKHTADETRKLYAFLLPQAQAGDHAALGCLMALLMALRSGDITRLDVRDVDLDGTQLNVDEGKTEASNEPRIIPGVLQPMLRGLASGRPADDPLFASRVKGKLRRHTRRWLEQAMERFCAKAYVPYVCPHSLKGTAGSILAKRGELANAIAEHLSHEETSTTMQHYVEPATVQAAQIERALKVISGGRK